MPRSTARDRALRRNQIIEAAAELFRRDGYERTGIDEIGAAVGLTGPAIYRYFGAKAGILGAVLDRVGTHAVTDAEMIAANARTPAEGIHRLVELHVDTVLDNPSLTFVILYQERALDRATLATVRRLQRRHIDCWVRMLTELRPELSAAEAGVVVRAAIMMVIAAAAAARPPIAREDLKRVLVHAMKDGLAVDDDRPRRGSARTSA